MAKRGNESAVVRRATSASADDDFYGEPSGTGPEAAVAVLDSILVWPRAAGSESERGITTIEGLHIFVPADGVTWAPEVAEEDQELRPEDQILVRGREYRMDGAVGDWRKKSNERVGWLFEVQRWAS